MATDDLTDEAFEGMARAVVAEPVPADLVDRCTELFTWRTVDSELAAIVEDLVAAGAVRDEAPVTILTFESPGWTVEVHVEVGALHGRVTTADGEPVADATVVAETPGAPVTALADELGGFRFAGVPRGPVRLTVRSAAGVVARTDWVTT